MLGIKIKRVTTKNEYTIQSLFEAIKDKTFTAGEPSLVKHGFNTLIVFPPLDSRNQVQIISAGKNKFQIMKAEQAGIGNSFKNSMMDNLTGGVMGLKSIAGKNAKLCEELVETTVKELDALGL